METNLFQCSDYKKYLNFKLDTLGRGSRAHLSKALGCQTSYLAQVLRGSAQFSLDQAEGCNRFFDHGEDEANFFLMLVGHAKAGTVFLKTRYELQIQALKNKRRSLKDRLGVSQPLGIEAQAKYYSSWIYAATHALISLPGRWDASRLARRLRISVDTAEDAIRFLQSCGLILNDQKRLGVGLASIHVGSDSPLVSKHHLNWRIRAMESLDRARPNDLHYSSVISLSESDAEIIREQWVKAIQSSKKIIRDSPSETIRVFSLDFFEI